MTTNPKQQLAFDQDIYSPPDANNDPHARKKARPTRKGSPKKPKPVATESLQPFLPGLSRRGRPRSKNPIPATLRATESRKRRIEAGGKRVELLLEPAVAADLEALVNHFRVSRGEVLGRLIAKAAKSLRRKI